jgi:hypothetical protein
MLVNFDAELKGLNGEVIKAQEGNVTLKSIVANALLGNYEDERNLQAEQKVKRYKLAHKVTEGGEIEVDAEDTVLMRKLVNKAYGTLIVGQVFDILK